jgi:hypothetical protein
VANAHGVGVRGRRLPKDVAAEGGRGHEISEAVQGKAAGGDEGSHKVVGAAAERDHGREIVGDWTVAPHDGLTPCHVIVSLQLQNFGVKCTRFGLAKMDALWASLRLDGQGRFHRPISIHHKAIYIVLVDPRRLRVPKRQELLLCPSC